MHYSTFESQGIRIWPFSELALTHIFNEVLSVEIKITSSMKPFIDNNTAITTLISINKRKCDNNNNEMIMIVIVIVIVMDDMDDNNNNKKRIK